MIAGALALGVLPLAMPASAQTTPLPSPPLDIVDACPYDDTDPDDVTTQVPDAGFTDIGGNIHEFTINCIVWYEVARGTSATTYSPANPVGRDQMASFIAQLIDYADVNGSGATLDPAPAGNQFPCDLTNSNLHFANIQRLAAEGIISGTGSSSAGACYNPSGAVSRAQMATFIKNAQDFINTTNVGPIAEDYFVDDDSDTHENNINIIADEQIARGTGVDANNEALYSPGANVSRAQMATFLANKLQVLVAAGTTEPPPAVLEVSVDDATPEQGQDIDVTVESVRANIDNITVTGCGLEDPDTDEFDAGNDSTTDTVVDLTIPEDQPTGACTLTIVTELDTTHPLAPIVVESTLDLTVNAA